VRANNPASELTERPAAAFEAGQEDVAEERAQSEQNRKAPKA
jgi:hypothetical protein